MKHELNVTIFLLVIFFLAQIVGLTLIIIDTNVYYADGAVLIDYDDTAIGERPDLEGLGSFLYIVLGVGIGTALLFLLIRLKFGGHLWKVWYGLAVFIAMLLALGVVMHKLFAIILSLLLVYVKMNKPNMFAHNLTELLMYAGLAVMLVPLFDVFWVTVLLVAISIYDAIAVWKSKHMVKLAQFTVESNLFAGLLVNYKKTKGKTKMLTTPPPPSKGKKTGGIKQAILGGGDIIFPLLFIGTVMIWLLSLGYLKLYALLLSLIMVITTTMALALLFYKAKKDHFYPAMPFISSGCLLGFIILLFVLQII